MTTRIALFGVTVAAAVLIAPMAPIHVDDPQPPPPAPPYQIATPDGPALPGNEVLPPICGVYMRGCGFTYSPDTGTWQPSAFDK